MTPTERVDILRCGIAALRQIEAVRRAALPNPHAGGVEPLYELRELVSFAERLEFPLGDSKSALDQSVDSALVGGRDAGLTIGLSEDDAAYAAELAGDVGARTPYRVGPPPPEAQRALLELSSLLTRYAAQEFMPPNAFFGIGEHA